MVIRENNFDNIKFALSSQIEIITITETRKSFIIVDLVSLTINTKTNIIKNGSLVRTDKPWFQDFDNRNDFVQAIELKIDDVINDKSISEYYVRYIN